MKTREYVGMFFGKPYVFRRLTTLSLEEFEMLREKLEPAWKESERKRLDARKNRKRKVGQGRPYELGSFRNLLFVTRIGEVILAAERSEADISRLQIPFWRCFLDEVRTFFEQNPH